MMSPDGARPPADLEFKQGRITGDYVALVLQIKREMVVPERVHSHEEFADAVLWLHDALSQPGQTYVPSGELMRRAYYLLGWLVGDAGKQFSRARSTARVSITLCKKHEENLPLGEFVSECIAMLGVPSGRIADQPPRPREPHGSYRWLSSYSGAIAWMKTACLGLSPEELTSYVPVEMDWLLTAPRDLRLWFLRGLADSDGTVDFLDRAVSIITAPNTVLVKRLFDSLGVHSSVEFDGDDGSVTISAKDAQQLQIFNPTVLTHRRKHLEKIASAAAYQRHWPDWLETKARRLLSEGQDVKSIYNRLLEEDHVYVKMKTLARKQSVYQDGATGET